jgi:hypothetical protein
VLTRRAVCRDCLVLPLDRVVNLAGTFSREFAYP